ncbi:hypothetical protein BDD12DRAFT_277375 [Trichophaea hybrida]|nr:hypothetical protein BDD12DRAFT_277375 [Trichophaea hybrida]
MGESTLIPVNSAAQLSSLLSLFLCTNASHTFGRATSYIPRESLDACLTAVHSIVLCGGRLMHAIDRVNFPPSLGCTSHLSTTSGIRYTQSSYLMIRFSFSYSEFCAA